MIPRKVNVLGQSWSVKIVEDLKDDAGNMCHGLCKAYETTIFINKDNERAMSQTLFHELFHATCARVAMHQAPEWHLSLEEIAGDNFATVLEENNVRFVKKKK